MGDWGGRLHCCENDKETLTAEPGKYRQVMADLLPVVVTSL